MSARVGIYSHSGLSTPRVAASSGRYTSDSLFLLKQPYLAGEVITATTASAQSTGRISRPTDAGSGSTASATAPDGASMFHVQVEPGKRVHVEVNPSTATARTATTSSPIYEGNTQIEAGPGWRLSILESDV